MLHTPTNAEYPYYTYLCIPGTHHIHYCRHSNYIHLHAVLTHTLLDSHTTQTIARYSHYTHGHQVLDCEHFTKGFISHPLWRGSHIKHSLLDQILMQETPAPGTHTTDSYTWYLKIHTTVLHQVLVKQTPKIRQILKLQTPVYTSYTLT